VTLELARVDPGNEILHVASDEEGRVVDEIGTNTDVALLNVGDGLMRWKNEEDEGESRG
jgi:hypothetical protein